jgi:hypothetical protein
MSGYSAAHDAVEAGDLAKLEEAIWAGADLEEEDGSLSLLQHAIDVESQCLMNANRLSADMTALLLDAGADPLRIAGWQKISAQQMAKHTCHWMATELIDEWIKNHSAG